MPEAGGVDTSSYNLPTQPSFLDIAGKLGGLKQQSQAIQSNDISIDQQKLSLIKDRFKIVSGQIPGLLSKPDLNESDIQQFYQNNVKNGYITPEQAAEKISQLPPTQGMPPAQAALTLKNHMGNEMQQAQTIMEALHYNLGGQGSIDNGASVNPTLSSPKPGFAGNPQAGGVVQPQPGIPIQPGPTQPIVSQGGPGQPSRGTPGIMGPSAPPTGLPTAPGGSIFPFKPGTAPPQIMGTGGVPTAGAPKPVPTQSFTPTGLPPGANAAMTASGEQLAQARLHGANFQNEIYPLVKAIPLLEKLGTKGTGPGTETWSDIKSFILSNVPGVTEKQISSVKDFDELRKYLVQGVNNSNLPTKSVDGLAAAFSGNPSTKISNAAAQDVTKSLLAVRRMQHAQYLAFEQTGLPESEFSRWLATNKVINPQVPGKPPTNYQIDPRAFGIDLMSEDARLKLLAELNKSPSEKAAFEASIELAKNSGFIAPPKGKKQ